MSTHRDRSTERPASRPPFNGDARPTYRHHFYSSLLWAQALRRMHEPSRPNHRQPPPTLDPRLVVIGKQFGVHREDFETDWAFARYVHSRLAHFLEHDLPTLVEALYRTMVEASREPNGAGAPIPPPSGPIGNDLLAKAIGREDHDCLIDRSVGAT